MDGNPDYWYALFTILALVIWVFIMLYLFESALVKNIWHFIKNNVSQILLIILILLLFYYFRFVVGQIEVTEGFTGAITTIALLIATIAAAINTISALFTRRALNLTMSTTRAFINFPTVKYIPLLNGLQLGFKNTGSLPGENIELQFELYNLDQYETPISTYNTTLPVAFPSQEIFHTLEWKDEPEIFSRIKSMADFDFKIIVKYTTLHFKDCSMTTMFRRKIINGEMHFHLLNEHSSWK